MPKSVSQNDILTVTDPISTTTTSSSIVISQEIEDTDKISYNMEQRKIFQRFHIDVHLKNMTMVFK